MKSILNTSITPFSLSLILMVSSLFVSRVVPADTIPLKDLVGVWAMSQGGPNHGLTHEQVEELSRQKVIREVSQDLTETEVEKLGKLIEDIDFEVDEIQFLPKTTTMVEGDDIPMFEKFLDMLNELDDVQNVFHNAELPEQ